MALLEDCEISERPRAYTWLVTILFLGALFFPVSARLLGFQWNEISGENRIQAPRPGLPRSSDELISFPARANTWFNDRFPFRKPLVEANGSWALMLGESPNYGVFIGRKKWLFYREGTDHLFSRTEVPTATIQAFDRMLRERAAWLKARGIAYLYIIVPDKHTVYPENLPLILAAQHGRNPSFREQLLSGISPEARALCLDLTPALRAAKDGRDLFLHSDTHWSFYGALAAQRALAEHLRPNYPSLRTLTEDDFSVTMKTEAGDLANFILQQERFREEVAVPVARDPRATPDDPNPPWKELAVHRYKQSDSNLPRVVVFGDSFLTALRPLLAETFGTTSVQVNTGEKYTQTEFVPAEIERIKPHLVISESIERLLPKQVLPNLPEVQNALSR